MAERFTPLIGLAVVVALAFAVVIGAVGLTNPAFAGTEPVVNPDGDLFRGQTTTTLTAVGGDGEVTLTYTARAADIVSGHTNEWRYRHAEANDNFPAWATPTTADLAATNTHSVTGLVNGRTYKFQAQAVTSAGVEIVGSRAPARGHANLQFRHQR